MGGQSERSHVVTCKWVGYKSTDNISSEPRDDDSDGCVTQHGRGVCAPVWKSGGPRDTECRRSSEI
jgi:hypothetical protein